MNIKKILQAIRRRILGLLGIEDLIRTSASETNGNLTSLITDFQHSNNQRNDRLQHSINQLQDSAKLFEKSISNIKESVEILSSPERLIPQLNAYTGKFYMALEYPPSRSYQPRWGYTHPVHKKLSQLFEKNRDEYLIHLNKLVAFKPFFDKISLHFDHSRAGEPAWLKTALNALDAALIYYFIAELKPKTYLEIGSGVSTLFVARAIQDHQLETKVISIDPDPRAEVDSVCDRVIRDGLETADLNIFSELEPGDIVFLDGSHRSFMNSDVTVFMLDILPLLKPGVIIGIHDILLPYDYPNDFRDWYWNEQYLLGTYLLGAAHRLKIIMPAQYISYFPELESILSPILENWEETNQVWLNGGSFWFTHQEFQEL